MLDFEIQYVSMVDAAPRQVRRYKPDRIMLEDQGTRSYVTLWWTVFGKTWVVRERFPHHQAVYLWTSIGHRYRIPREKLCFLKTGVI
jgi:hypothetical protein